MSLILLTISLSVALAMLAFRLAVFALPVMAAMGALQHVQSADAGFALRRETVYPDRHRIEGFLWQHVQKGFSA